MIDKFSAPNEGVFDNQLSTLLVKEGVKTLEKMTETNAAAERYKADAQKEVSLRHIESKERIERNNNIFGGLALLLLIGLLTWLNLTGNSNETLNMSLVFLLAGAIGKFLGLSFPSNAQK